MDAKKIKLGIAPIGWTNDDMPDLGSENTFEQCVSEMALAGFEGCEIGNKSLTAGFHHLFSPSLLMRLRRISERTANSLRAAEQRESVLQSRATAFRDRWIHLFLRINTL